SGGRVPRLSTRTSRPASRRRGTRRRPRVPVPPVTRIGSMSLVVVKMSVLPCVGHTGGVAPVSLDDRRRPRGVTALFDDRLAQRFEEHRDRLTAIARRMLGSRSEADDAVQETWIRLIRTD